MEQDKRATRIELYARDRQHVAYIKSRLSLSTQVAVIRYALEFLAMTLKVEEKQEDRQDDV
jgi:hypothetical protein